MERLSGYSYTIIMRALPQRLNMGDLTSQGFPELDGLSQLIPKSMKTH